VLKLASINRWQAAGGHLAISAIVGVAVLAAMILVWYPPPYFQASGGNDLVLLMVGIDVALGPLLTFAVFNPRKGLGKLRLDLAIIAFLQVAALAYGVHVMFTARPAYLVYAVDRFDLIMANLLFDRELAKAPPPWNRRPIGRPPTIGVKIPEDPKLRDQSLFDALAGVDLPQQARYYVPYSEVAKVAAARSRSIDELRKLDPPAIDRIDAAVRASGRDESQLGFLGAAAPNRDFAVVVDRNSGEIVDMLMARPWPAAARR
jgi:hypothetical protein